MKDNRNYLITILIMICLVLAAITFESKRELDAIKVDNEQVVYELREELNETNDLYQKATHHIWMMNIQLQEERSEQ